MYKKNIFKYDNSNDAHLSTNYTKYKLFFIKLTQKNSAYNFENSAYNFKQYFFLCPAAFLANLYPINESLGNKDL